MSPAPSARSVSEALAAGRGHLRAPDSQTAKGEVLRTRLRDHGAWITLADDASTVTLFVPNENASGIRALHGNPMIEVAAGVRQNATSSEWYFVASEPVKITAKTGPLEMRRIAALKALE